MTCKTFPCASAALKALRYFLQRPRARNPFDHRPQRCRQKLDAHHQWRLSPAGRQDFWRGGAQRRNRTWRRSSIAHLPEHCASGMSVPQHHDRRITKMKANFIDMRCGLVAPRMKNSNTARRWKRSSTSSKSSTSANARAVCPMVCKSALKAGPRLAAQLSTPLLTSQWPV